MLLRLPNYKLAKLIKKKVFLLSLHLFPNSIEQTRASLEELGSLARTLNLEVVGSELQKKNQIHPKTFIGAGKIQDCLQFFVELKPELVFVDQNLTPAQERNLSDLFQIEVWDRTRVILKIFELQAQTNEAQDQVELAMLQYILPRLSGMWQHLDRERGGTSVSKGMGEKQLQIDRNLIRKRITALKKKLEKYQTTIGQQIKGREKFFKVSLVGYTNVGKSSLMNSLTQTKSYVADKPFATLGTTTRIIEQLCKPDILLSDTVGFIRSLPHSLIASFRSTFSVIKDSALLLHIIEVASPEEMENSIKTSQAILEELGLDSIPRLFVINKMDKLKSAQEKIQALQALSGLKISDALWVSALDEKSILKLKSSLQQFFEKNFVRQKKYIDYFQKDVISFLYKNSTIKDIRYKPNGIQFEYSLSEKNAQKLISLERAQYNV